MSELFADPDALWCAIGEALPRWRPRSIDHIAPVALLTAPVLADTLTPERGRALLCRPRGDHRLPPQTPAADHDERSRLPQRAPAVTCLADLQSFQIEPHAAAITPGRREV
ncbi:hypothetical protein [Actinoallomurus sp. NPDC050550]|uniref:hypothetical protein n=1 Tax=Actinoallomurus sp. NPDC050550 TaxID=3154937 RepID=UPI0033E2086A